MGSSSSFSGGPSGGCAFIAHAPKSSPSPPPRPPLVGGRAARAVEGSDRCRERMACQWGRPRLFRGPEWWRRVRRPQTEVVAVDTATAATHRWRAVRAVEGSDRCGGTDGMGSSSSVSGAGVGARETRWVLRGVSDWGAAREDDELKGRQPAGAHDASATCVHTGHNRAGMRRHIQCDPYPYQ
jgi:hypothetical protein